jgi:hypothetical protein
VGRILKAKYFPRSSFLEVFIGNHPSYAWRSILSARELLHKGILWRVGDGTKIQIWRDRWLPTPTTYKIQSAPIPQMEDSRVAMLINRDTKMWDISLLHVLFRHEEVKVITNMPISPFLPPDRLIWQGTKNGSFSVQSAYHLGMELQDQSRGQSSTIVKEPGVWKSLWNL